MIEINLIPDVKQELLKAQRARAVVISASILTSIIAVGVVILLVVYMFGVQGVRNLYLDGQISDKGDQLSKVEDLSKILTIQNQLKTITDLNGQKNMETRVFDMISAITPPGDDTVTFSQITIGATQAEESAEATEEAAPTGGQVYLEGQTAGYDSMEVFKKTLENTTIQYVQDGETKTVPLAANISTSDTSYGEDADKRKVFRFTLSFDYPAELLSPMSKQVSFKLNINGNVTDSYLGIPHFTERAKDLEGEQ
jgi:Tfp pilus assembly protein PilN